MEICKQGVSGRQGKLAVMHTSTGDGKSTQMWMKVTGNICWG